MTAFDPIHQPLKGAHSIEASAGTGKTYSITLLWLRLIVELGLKIDEILVSTFTTAATAELKDRLLHSLRSALTVAQQTRDHQPLVECPEAPIIQRALSTHPESLPNLITRLTSALSAFDLAPISTIHGFCQSLITRHALELGCDSDLTLVPDADEILEQIINDELMLMANQPGLEPETLKLAGKKVALAHNAELRFARLDSEAALTSLRIEVLREADKTLQTLPQSRVKQGIVDRIEDLRATKHWAPFTAPQQKALNPDFVDLWNSVWDLEREHLRQPLTQLAKVVSSEFPKRKESAGLRTFDDILTIVQTALDHPTSAANLANAVRHSFKAAIIDECQDSDGVQIGVFDKLFRHPDTLSFIVIGDPKQSIYRFRGADLASYKQLAAAELVSRAPAMNVNHRSDPALIHAINQLYGTDFIFPDALAAGQETHYLPVGAAAKTSRIHDPAEPNPLVFQWVDSGVRDMAKQRLAEHLALECQRLLFSNVQIEDRHTKTLRRLRPCDIAVLASGHAELRLVRQALTQLSIPAQSSGTGLGSVFGTDEARDILAWLTLLETLGSHGDILQRLLAFLGTPLGGFTAKGLLELQQNSTQQAQLCAHFQTQLTELERNGPLPLLLHHLAQPEVITANLPCAEGERRFTNWQHLAALLQHQFGRGKRSPEALSLWLTRQIAAKPTSSNDDPDSNESALMKLETDADAVQLVTIHNSKGLEYPVVFCPYLWHVRSRSVREKTPTALLRQKEHWLLDVGSQKFQEHLSIALEQENEEEHRKLYVALTRARHRLYLGIAPVGTSQSHDNSAEKSALAHLPGLHLKETPLSEWRTALSQVPNCSLLELPLLPSDSPFNKTPVQPPSSQLLPPPPITPYPFPFHRTHSFSSLSKSDEDHTSPVDRDEDGIDPESEYSTSDGLLKPLGEAGAILGDRLHSVLEDILGNRRSLEDTVTSLEPEKDWLEIIPIILETPLPLPQTLGLTLASIQDRCITEMQFHLPAGNLAPQSLTEVFLRDPSIQSSENRVVWAERIGRWAFGKFSGFLQGFIDLIFEHEGRWYVADYKSNKLGGYTGEFLEEAMLEKNYLLQARLYALALHRHLSVQLEGYQFEEHFGGVAYLFMRGFPQQGTWFERPSHQSLEDLGRLFSKTSQ